MYVRRESDEFHWACARMWPSRRRRWVEVMRKEQHMVNKRSIAGQNLVATHINIGFRVHCHWKTAIDVIAARLHGVSCRRLNHHIRNAGAPCVGKAERFR